MKRDYGPLIYLIGIIIIWCCIIYALLLSFS